MSVATAQDTTEVDDLPLRIQAIIAEADHLLPDYITINKASYGHLGGVEYHLRHQHNHLRVDDIRYPMTSFKLAIYPSTHRDGMIMASLDLWVSDEAAERLYGLGFPNSSTRRLLTRFSRFAGGELIWAWWEEVLGLMARVREVFAAQEVAQARKKRMEGYGGVCAQPKTDTRGRAELCGTFCSEYGL